MKYQKLLLSFVIVLTFIGGFFTGQFFSNKTDQEAVPKNMEKADQPEKKAEKPTETKLQTEKESSVLIGYVQDFRDPAVLDYSELTHVIFSFAHPSKDGSLLFNGDTAVTNLRTMVSKAHEHETKAILAIGGWYHIQGGESYPYFKEAISNPSSRSKLINELVNITNRENLDGIDIDFEHPRSTEDAQSLAAFTKELSEKLHHKEKELSIAVNAKVHSVAGTEVNNVVYEPSMFKYVDHVNIMAYDGQWDGEYNGANLSPYPYNVNIVNYWASLFDKHNLAKEKLVLGVPFYAQPEDPARKQVSYKTIINSNPENASADSARLNGITYYYNGAMTVQKKTKLALDNGFGGMMLWEAGHDAEGTHSLISVISETLTEEI